ncbi:hypothetical protein K435DRAFT_620467, partial [Dendrothele bispora CBS 962.96]
LRANYQPSSIEAASIRSSLDVITRDIATYDAEIDSISLILSRLKEQREAALRMQSIASSLLAPIRKLPVEILTEIFKQHCLKEMALFRVHFAETFGRTMPPALSVASVCRFWRNIANSNAFLW